MRGLWLDNQSKDTSLLVLRDDLPIPALQVGEALIRMRLAGICGTDLELLRGYYPYRNIPGHEFTGEVVEAPDYPEWIGKRVVGEINLVCGSCRMCRTGNPTHCEQRQVLGILDKPGVFAEYLTLPLVNLHHVPDNVPDEVAVFAEPLAAALEIQQQVSLQPDSRVLLIGAGRLGQLIAQTLSLTGCDLQVVARHPRQRTLLRARGIPVLDASQVGERCFDLVVEATGSPDGFYLARRAIRPRGVLVLKSTYPGDLQVNFSSMVVDELTLVGSRCGPFAPALRLMATGQVDPRGLIEARYSLAEGLAAFAHAAQPGTLKIILTST